MSKLPSPKERPDLYDSYDCQEPSKPASQKYWDSVMPEHVKKAIAERQAKSDPTTPSADKSCQCFDPSAEPEWIDQTDIGMTDGYWDITRMRCARCGTAWVRAFLEYEAFSRSGRHYRAPACAAALPGITPESALQLITEASFRIAGGSYFGGKDHVSNGPSALIASP